MITQAEFLDLLDDELGLDYTPADLDRDVDELPRWDSVYLWRLLTALEARTGRPLPFDRLLTTRTLDGLRKLAADDA
ncbi:acyl carrier protein [Micromonospora sp. DT233]|uniref:acyl carrier protein n=1 Tax=Micromonospora sp. DT233 TaxID=3393432 RepID=UPI003CF09E93